MILNKLKVVWYDILSHRYGEIKETDLDRSWITNSRNDSLWWRDLTKEDGSLMKKHNWFG